MDEMVLGHLNKQRNGHFNIQWKVLPCLQITAAKGPTQTVVTYAKDGFVHRRRWRREGCRQPQVRWRRWRVFSFVCESKVSGYFSEGQKRHFTNISFGKIGDWPIFVQVGIGDPYLSKWNSSGIFLSFSQNNCLSTNNSYKIIICPILVEWSVKRSGIFC